MNNDWCKKAPAGSPDNYVTTRDVTFSWVNPPEWIYGIISRADYSDAHGSICAARKAVEPTLICCVATGFFFDVSVVGGNAETLPGALPHDRMYAASKAISGFYGISQRTALHIADHWFLATLRMSGWKYARTYFIAVRAFGYLFHRLTGND